MKMSNSATGFGMLKRHRTFDVSEIPYNFDTRVEPNQAGQISRQPGDHRYPVPEA